MSKCGTDPAGPSSAEIAVKSGEKIAFLGDSITAGGWGNPLGYVRLVLAGLEANGVKAEAVPAGISGHKSDHMLARLERDVISQKPQWMTLSCGVNDVWHGKNGVALDAAQLKRAQAAWSKVEASVKAAAAKEAAAKEAAAKASAAQEAPAPK